MTLVRSEKLDRLLIPQGCTHAAVLPHGDQPAIVHVAGAIRQGEPHPSDWQGMSWISTGWLELSIIVGGLKHTPT
jgi:hypothetical protein